MSDLVKKIAQADEFEIRELLQAVLRRHNELLPEWEVSVISLQRSTDKNEQLDRIIKLLQNMKTPS